MALTPQDIEIHSLSHPKSPATDESKLVFGKEFTNRMFALDYSQEQGWHQPRIQEYGPLQLDPAALVLHYAQEIFEGLKAFRQPDGGIALFRPRDNFVRMNHGARRMCMPELDPDFALAALQELLRLEAQWVPSSPGTSLYIRPTMIATEPVLGVKPASQYLFYIILSPVAAYYKNGLSPVKIWISDDYVRAAPGGTGAVKTGGNYGASLYASTEAAAHGYDQVLWLDAKEKRYIEEVGSMNMCFVRDGKVITSPLDGTILDGITRRCVLQLLADMGIEVEERSLTVDEVMADAASGRITEAFGTGTAVVISPVAQLTYKDRTVTLGDGDTGELSQKLYDTLTGIQYGHLEDPYGWRLRL